MEVQSEVGELQIKVNRAQGLKAQDSKGLPDTCVEIIFGNEKVKTKVIKKDVNPTWLEEFKMKILKPFGEIEIFVWDSDRTNLGKATVDITTLSHQQNIKKELKLKPMNLGEIVSGKIELELCFNINQEYQDLFIGIKGIQDRNTISAIRAITDYLENPKYQKFKSTLLLYRSDAYFADRRFEEALNDTQNAIDNDPNDPEGYYKKGLIYFLNNDFTKAQDYFDTGLEKNPNHQQLKALRNQIERQKVMQAVNIKMENVTKLFLDRQFKEAQAILANLIETYPNVSIFRLYQACVLLGARDFNNAEKTIMDVIHTDPAWLKQDNMLSGKLMKRGGINTRYKERFFVLKENFFLFYSKDSYREPEGVILVYRTKIERKENEFTIHASRRAFKLKAASAEEATKWVTLLEECSKKGLRIPRIKEKEIATKDAVEEQIIRKTITNAGKAVMEFMPSPVQNVTKDITKKVVSAAKYSTGAISGVGNKVVMGLTNVLLANIIHEGILLMLKPLSTLIKGSEIWESSYFILKFQALYSFPKKPEPNEEGFADISASIMLNLSNSILSESADKSLENIFELNIEGKVWAFKAASIEDKFKWKEKISKAKEVENEEDDELVSTVEPEVNVEEPKTEIQIKRNTEPEPVVQREVEIEQLSERTRRPEDRYFQSFGLPPVTTIYTKDPQEKRNSSDTSISPLLSDAHIEFDNVLDIKKGDSFSSKSILSESSPLMPSYDPYEQNYDEEQNKTKSCCACTVM